MGGKKFLLLFDVRRRRHVSGRREEDGKPAEEVGGHDEKPQVCVEPGKFAGKSSGLHLVHY